MKEGDEEDEGTRHEDEYEEPSRKGMMIKLKRKRITFLRTSGGSNRPWWWRIWPCHTRLQIKT